MGLFLSILYYDTLSVKINVKLFGYMDIISYVSFVINDKTDMNTKIKELMKVVGEVTSENFSPTLRAKLLAIDESRGGGVCIMEVVESPYTSMKTMGSLNAEKVGMRYEAPVYRIHNAFFF